MRSGLYLLLLVAVLITAGRLFTALIDTQRSNIAEAISAMTGLETRIDQLSGDWWRFSPILSIDGLELQFPNTVNAGQLSSHRIEHIDLLLNLPESLWQRSLVIDTVRLQQLELELIENAQGWTLAGFAASEFDSSDALLDFFLTTSGLQFDNLSLTLQRQNGARVSINDVSAQLVNQDSDHRFHLTARLEQQARPITLMGEMTGDPRSSFSASAYMRAQALDLVPLVPFLDTRDLVIDEVRGGVEMWAQWSQAGTGSIRGRLENMTAQGDDGGVLGLDLNNGRVNFSLQKMNDRWQVWLSDMTFDWQDRSWEPADLYLDLNTGPGRALSLQAQRVDLSITTDLLMLLSNLPERGRSVLEELSPSGFLSNLNLQTSLDGVYSDSFLLRGNLEEVAVGAWQNAPAGSGIDGYIEAGINSGFVELDSNDFEIYLPNLFEESWRYSTANSRVHWDVSPETIRVNSSVIDVANQELQGRVQFDLYNTRNEQGRWDSRFSLLIGIQSFNTRDRALYLPTLEVIAPTMNWLDQSVESGNIQNSGFVFRGAIHSNPPPGSSTVQTWFNFSDVMLRYLPDWPLLEETTGQVIVDNNDAEIATDGGVVSGIRLNPVTAALHKNTDSPGSTLTISSTADTRADTALAFLKNSPVREAIGDFIGNWEADGGLELELDLVIPLAQEDAQPRIDFVVTSDNGTLGIPDYNLEFEQVSGRLRYRSEEGLSANALSARLFDFPVATRISPLPDRNGAVQILANGRASVIALQDWPGQPPFVSGLLDFAAGEFDYQADLQIYNPSEENAPEAQLNITSDLLGMAWELPAPFNKTEDDNRELSLQMVFTGSGQQLTGRYANRLYSQIALNADGIERGLVFLGEQSQGFNVRQANNRESGLTVTGALERFNLEQWREIAGQITGTENQTLEPSSFLRVVDVNIGQLELMEQQLMDINTQVRPTSDGWDVRLDNDVIRGSFMLVNDPEIPHAIALEYLRLPAPEIPEIQPLPEEREDRLANINPGNIPDLVFTTAEFSIGEQNLGAWHFALDSFDRGAHIRDFRVEMADAIISDADDENGAVMEWQYRNGVHSSSFSGIFQAGNLASVLPSLGYDANIESDQARFSGNLYWEGSPAAFSIVGSSGRIDMDIDEGRFVNIESGSSRLLGAFRFDSIVRRLQLDFSDLFGRGLVFDNIDGGLMFDQGTVITEEEIVIDGPSSRIALAGQIDLREETIQADMLVTLPLSQNLSVLAGILGAWPLAVSTYIASKIFQEQVDEFTSVVYRLEGPWENLDAGFEPPDETSEDVQSRSAETQ